MITCTYPCPDLLSVRPTSPPATHAADLAAHRLRLRGRPRRPPSPPPLTRAADRAARHRCLTLRCLRGRPRRPQPTLMAPQKIPNVYLAKFDTQHALRVFFPRLYRKERQSAVLSQAELRIFYNQGVRAAVKRIVPTAIGDWPPSYDTELFRARNHRQGFAWGSKLLSADDVEEFSDALIECLSEVDWARDIVFQTQIRGVKLAHYHEPNLFNARTALEILMDTIDTRSGHWWVDVGLEFSMPDKCLLWRTDGHNRLAAEVLQIGRERAGRITTPGRHCQRDLSTHLTDVSGFRASVASRQTDEIQATYIQAYTTDKSVTYHADGRHHAKYITGPMAMKGTPPQFCNSLLAAYGVAMQEADVAARVEVRVPLAVARRVMVDGLPRATYQRCLIVYPRSVWW